MTAYLWRRADRKKIPNTMTPRDIVRARVGSESGMALPLALLVLLVISVMGFALIGVGEDRAHRRDQLAGV